jgi:hypothetical protein
MRRYFRHWIRKSEVRKASSFSAVMVTAGTRTMIKIEVSSELRVKEIINPEIRHAWGDLRERKQRSWRYTRDQRSDQDIVGLIIPEARRWRARSVVRRRVAVSDDRLRQSRKRIGKVPFELQFLIFEGLWWRLSQRESGRPQRGPQDQARRSRPNRESRIRQLR